MHKLIGNLFPTVRSNVMIDMEIKVRLNDVMKQALRASEEVAKIMT